MNFAKFLDSDFAVLAHMSAIVTYHYSFSPQNFSFRPMSVDLLFTTPPTVALTGGLNYG